MKIRAIVIVAVALIVAAVIIVALSTTGGASETGERRPVPAEKRSAPTPGTAAMPGGDS